MPSYDVKSGDKSVLATKIDSSQTSNIKIAAMNINGSDTAWVNQSGGVIEVRQETPGTTKREWIYYTGGTQNSDSSFTLTGVVRGIARDSSDVTSGGTGVAFEKGAEVRFVTFHDLINKKANLDRANTWTAAQTFGAAGRILFTNTTTAALVAQNATTAQRDAFTTNANGAIIYNSTTGQTQFYEGGAWVANAAGGSVADASATVAGKVEIATTAEIRAETATGGTGAVVVIPADATAVLKDDRIVLKDATELTIASGAITATQSYHSVDTESDAASDDLDTLTAAVGNGEVVVLVASNTARTVVVKHNTGNIKTSDGLDFSLDDTEKSITLLKQTSNWIEIARGAGSAVTRDYVKCVYHGASDSATLTNPTTLTAFDTHTYAIPASDLVDNVAYEVEGSIDIVRGAASDWDVAIMLGSTAYAQCSVTLAGNSVAHFRGIVYGTTTAGAAAAVRTQMTCILGPSDGTGADYGADYASVNAATNGALTLQIGCVFGTSNAGHTATLKTLLVNKISSTIFTS